MKRVLMAMSGGIDSTVAAMMLAEQGYEVIGITMKTWDYATTTNNKANQKQTGCCDVDAFNDARSVAHDYKFPHYILDIREEFTDSVIDNFVEEYIAGRTPNPCIMCNTHIKWKALLKRAEALKCDFIATGHYAKIRYENKRYILSKATDLNKDQSYVLWGLSQDVLKKTIFPLGNLLKTEVREYAKNKGYEKLSQKKESYEICFIPNNDYREFLSLKQKNIIEQISENGIFKNTKGEVIGKHKGYPFFTIGQRKGLGQTFGKPKFVVDIIANENVVVLGDKEDLLEVEMNVKNINLIKYQTVPENLEVITKIRYKDIGTNAKIKDTGMLLKINFAHTVKGITPGQSAVFYEGDDVIGGGIIC